MNAGMLIFFPKEHLGSYIQHLAGVELQALPQKQRNWRQTSLLAS